MIKMIWAVSENGWIGRNGSMPWYVPAEMKHFKKLTAGQTVIMGRKTWESLPQPLSGRENVIVSTSLSQTDVPYATVIDNPRKVLSLFEDVWIIGGGELFDFFMPHADELHVSVVPETVDGDVKEPDISSDMWETKVMVSYPEFDYEYYVRKNS